MPKYGLIGRTLKHSFSKIIHERLFDDAYELIELEPLELDSFMKSKDFIGVNVTIPYKQAVIPYLDYISDEAKEIGAVNTIVNKNGKLYGYNTDYLGFKESLIHHNIDIKDKNVLLLGNGGTSKTVRYTLKEMGAKSIKVVSRHNEENTISYNEAYKCSDTQVIVNVTPVGMFPNNEDCILDINKYHYPKLESLVDVIYNPLKTSFLINGEYLNKNVVGGLYMLIGQAIYAAELFHDVNIDKSIISSLYKEIYNQKRNIVLIGMPSSGKSTIGKILSEKLHKDFYDTDKEIESRSGVTTDTFIKERGIKEFRKYETSVVKDASKMQNLIISTGGGVILNSWNMDCLKQNGVIIFIDRPLELLTPTDDRPLSSSKDDLKKRYEERYEIYKKYADVVVNNDKDINDVIMDILKEIN